MKNRDLNFIPTTMNECKDKGWNTLDIILISGDTYIDTYYDGAALIGKVLMDKGYKVGIIAQPGLDTEYDIKRLGEPSLFWGITAGCCDSMVANYTALKKKRKDDDFTPGSINNKRPDRACIVYSNLIKRFWKNTVPIVLGGVEASLRRIAHYDYWDDKVRKSILFDTKADYLVYGMGEKTILELAEFLKNNNSKKQTIVKNSNGNDKTDKNDKNDIKNNENDNGKDKIDNNDIQNKEKDKIENNSFTNHHECINYPENIPGLCYIAKQPVKDYLTLPSFEEASSNYVLFNEMFTTFYKNQDCLTARGLQQKTQDRYLIHNRPQFDLKQDEIDTIYGLPFERDVHPYYKTGNVKALDTVRFSVTSHRGCYGECNFCSIAVHQGRKVISRSIGSIESEILKLTQHQKFTGIISDIGGPTANMYGIECSKKMKEGSCSEKRCLYPFPCSQLVINHEKQLLLLNKISLIKQIRKVFIASGIRYDMVIHDKINGRNYLNKVLNSHSSGQIKIAPEHMDDEVLALMGKPKKSIFLEFQNLFKKINETLKKKIQLTYYFIAAYPGSTKEKMQCLSNDITVKLGISPEQVQIFTPLPSTYAACIYYTGIDPFTKKKVFVEKDLKNKKMQKDIII